MLTPIKLTPADIEALIIGEEYYRFPGTTVMTCCLKVKGWDGTEIGITGESAVIDPEGFVETTGKSVARRRAVDKLWELEGYHVKRMHAMCFDDNDQVLVNVIKPDFNKDNISIGSPVVPEWFSEKNRTLKGQYHSGLCISSDPVFDNKPLPLESLEQYKGFYFISDHKSTIMPNATAYVVCDGKHWDVWYKGHGDQT